MPPTSQRILHHRLRRVAHQVEPPRLRPVWRIALTGAATTAAAALIVIGIAYFVTATGDSAVQAARQRIEAAQLAADHERARNAPTFDFEGCLVDTSFATCDEGYRAAQEKARRALPREQGELRTQRMGAPRISKECLDNPLSRTCR